MQVDVEKVSDLHDCLMNLHGHAALIREDLPPHALHNQSGGA